ncbi:glycosyltransferase family A protein [Balneolales bacterium ANBcel1]|nr:glycosyltransferase family A protein [Balneolales bacterium ANBcel1]
MALTLILILFLFFTAVPAVVGLINMVRALSFSRLIKQFAGARSPSGISALATEGDPDPASADNAPLVSVLIPARNEENNIAACLESVSRQSVRPIEILVLDDQSEDATASVVEEMASKDNRIVLLKGRPLPDGWLGKNWACHQLSQKALGRRLLFIDADVHLEPDALATMLKHQDDHPADLLSLFPTQRMQTAGEWLVVPLMNWILLSFLPMELVYRSSDPSFVAANGQFMLFRAGAYRALGGHESVRREVVEDMALARIFKQNGKRVITRPDGGVVSCRMYPGLRASLDGFTKNFFPGFNSTPFRFLMMLAVVFLLFTLPLFLLFHHQGFLLALVPIALNRFFTSVASRQNPVINVLLHPLQMVFLVIVGIRSVRAAKQGSIIWKDRRV